MNRPEEALVPGELQQFLEVTFLKHLINGIISLKVMVDKRERLLYLTMEISYYTFKRVDLFKRLTPLSQSV